MRGILCILLILLYLPTAWSCAELGRLTTVGSDILGRMIHHCGEAQFHIRLYQTEPNKTLYAVETRWLKPDEESKFVFKNLPAQKYRVELYQYVGGGESGLTLLDGQTLPLPSTQTNLPEKCQPAEAQRVCYQGHAWWKDGCGKNSHLTQYCYEDELCAEGRCAPLTSSKAVNETLTPLPIPTSLPENRGRSSWPWLLLLVVVTAGFMYVRKRYMRISSP